MAGKPATLSVQILADATDAVRGMDQAGDAAEKYERRTSEAIETVGDRSGDTATGLSALSGALDAAGFTGLASAMDMTATAMDAAEGSTILFKVAQESLNLATLKATATKIKDTAATVANTAASKAAQGAAKAWAAAQWLVNAAMSANPIALIIIAIIAVIAVIVLLWNKCAWFRDAVMAVWEAVKNAAEAVWNAILAAGQVVFDFLVSVWEGILAAAQAVWNAILAAVQWVIDAIVAYAKFILSIYVAVWEAILAAAKWVWNGIVAVVTWVVDKIVGVVRGIVAIITGIWQSIVDTAKTWWDKLVGIVETVMDNVLKPIEWVRDAFDDVVEAIRGVIDWLGKIKIPDVLSNIGDTLGGLFGRSAPASRSFSRASVAARGARAFAGPGLAAAGSAGGGGVTINVNGALDPVAVARQIRSILTADQRRRGGVVIAA